MGSGIASDFASDIAIIHNSKRIANYFFWQLYAFWPKPELNELTHCFCICGIPHLHALGTAHGAALIDFVVVMGAKGRCVGITRFDLFSFSVDRLVAMCGLRASNHSTNHTWQAGYVAQVRF